MAARGENEDRVAPSSGAGRGAAGAAAAALKHGPRARRSGCRGAHWGVAVSPRAEQRPPRPAIVAGARSACPECPLAPRRLRQLGIAGRQPSHGRRAVLQLLGPRRRCRHTRHRPAARCSISSFRPLLNLTRCHAPCSYDSYGGGGGYGGGG